jgi:hypothetical protein
MSEVDVVFGAMTDQELREAGELIAARCAQFEATGLITVEHRPATCGPVMALDAWRLAWMREVLVRGGATPWEIGDPLDGHPAATLVERYLERANLSARERELWAQVGALVDDDIRAIDAEQGERERRAVAEAWFS